ncbi:TIGR02270 family protein [Myxococcus sp. RHSTA-1-4]|uniref:TIGR02270 family protein n=1 Tax=Myxococcus sp. RHSTA-1-4 TaxID=2874601 RepID=UPI001CBCBE03|nr:TIGR02270 family protein [Myxococcus sp. RHSTA-1-4]
MTPPLSRRPAIRWELLERHLEEAEFLWTQWERGLWDSALTLEDVAGGDEGRLHAHLDALVVAGAPAAQRFLLPALESEEPALVAASAWTLLAAEDSNWRGHLLQRMEDAPEAIAPGVLRALELSGRTEFQAWVLQVLPRQAPALQAGLLRVLRLQHVSASAVLGGLDVEAEPALHAEALRAAAFAPGTVADTLLARGLEHTLPAVRDAALETGLLLGSRAAWEQARRRATSREPVPRAALLALAVAGESRDSQTLVGRLADPEAREEVLWALGFSGRLAAAEALLPLLQDESLGALAAESFAAITGLPLAPPHLLPEPPPEDEEEEPETPVEDLRELLPRPLAPPGRVDGKAVERWWTSVRGGFAAEGRYLRGALLTVDRLASALEGESMRRRPGLAWELAMRSGGALCVETRLWTSAQRQQARALASLRPEVLTRGWSRLVSR